MATQNRAFDPLEAADRWPPNAEWGPKPFGRLDRAEPKNPGWKERGPGMWETERLTPRLSGGEPAAREGGR